MSAKAPHRPRDEQALMADIWDPRIADDPYQFARFVYSWGSADTPLARFDDLRRWQIEELEAIADFIRRQQQRAAIGLPYEIHRVSVVSGRGPGKTMLEAVIQHWFASTRLGGTCIIAANTEEQLRTRTFPEISKWRTLAINSHWFDHEGLIIKPAAWFDESLKNQLKIDTGYYYTRGQLWTETNPDAFAGVHNHHGVCVIFEEASGIADAIWGVTDPGFFTEPIQDRYFFSFSNGRRMYGKFFRIHNPTASADEGAGFRKVSINSLEVEGLDHAALQAVIDKYGINSYQARVDVLGKFPIDNDEKFIKESVAREASLRVLGNYFPAGHRQNVEPFIIGIDAASDSANGDEIVAWFRQGADARSIPPRITKGLDSVGLANWIFALYLEFQPDMIFLDLGGGKGAHDILRNRRIPRLTGVWFGGKSSDPLTWFDKRAEMYDLCRVWMADGGMIPQDDLLIEQLCAPKRDDKVKTGLKVESKRDMRARNVKGPFDRADALVLTFAGPVMARSRGDLTLPQELCSGLDYPIFG